MADIVLTFGFHLTVVGVCIACAIIGVAGFFHFANALRPHLDVDVVLPSSRIPLMDLQRRRHPNRGPYRVILAWAWVLFSFTDRRYWALLRRVRWCSGFAIVFLFAALIFGAMTWWDALHSLS
jgi:hypothetical protein